MPGLRPPRTQPGGRGRGDVGYLQGQPATGDEYLPGGEQEVVRVFDLLQNEKPSMFTGRNPAAMESSRDHHAEVDKIAKRRRGN